MKRIYWISGLPGSGKTTAALALKKYLFEEKKKCTLHLDGDSVREGLNFNFGYSKKERIEVGTIILNFAKMIADQCISEYNFNV